MTMSWSRGESRSAHNVKRCFSSYSRRFKTLDNGDLLTETPSLDVSFLPRSGIRVHIPQRRAMADGEVLVETVLFRAGKTWFVGVVGVCEVEDGVVCAKAYAFEISGAGMIRRCWFGGKGKGAAYICRKRRPPICLDLAQRLKGPMEYSLAQIDFCA